MSDILAEIRNAQKLMRETDPQLKTLFGMKLIESPYLPKEPRMKLSKEVNVTDQFRAEFDAWLLERFGTKEVGYAISGPFGEYLAVSPAMMREITRHVAKVAW